MDFGVESALLVPNPHHLLLTSLLTTRDALASRRNAGSDAGPSHLHAVALALLTLLLRLQSHHSSQQAEVTRPRRYPLVVQVLL